MKQNKNRNSNKDMQVCIHGKIMLGWGNNITFLTLTALLLAIGKRGMDLDTTDKHLTSDPLALPRLSSARRNRASMLS